MAGLFLKISLVLAGLCYYKPIIIAAVLQIDLIRLTAQF